MRTLSAYASLCTDFMLKGVMETIIKESPVLNFLPFRELVGNSIVQNWEKTLPTVAWRNVGEAITESSGETVDMSFILKILIGDVDTDCFAARTRSNINDQHEVDVEMKAKAMAHEFEDTFIYGVASGSKEFNGLHYLASTYGTSAGFGATDSKCLHAGTGSTDGSLTTTLLDDLVDLVPNADILLMRKSIRGKLTRYLRGVGSYMSSRELFGHTWPCWGNAEVPIVTSDFLLQTEAISATVYNAKTGGTGTSIFAIRFGDGDGVCGLQGGEMWKRHWPELEGKNAMRTRFGWYVGLMTYQPDALAQIDGIANDTVSA